jgi:hypothetical protein
MSHFVLAVQLHRLQSSVTVQLHRLTVSAFSRGSHACACCRVAHPFLHIAQEGEQSGLKGVQPPIKGLVPDDSSSSSSGSSNRVKTPNDCPNRQTWLSRVPRWRATTVMGAAVARVPAQMWRRTERLAGALQCRTVIGQPAVHAYPCRAVTHSAAALHTQSWLQGVPLTTDGSVSCSP